MRIEKEDTEKFSGVSEELKFVGSEDEVKVVKEEK